MPILYKPEAFLAKLLGEFHLGEEPPLRLRLVHGRAADPLSAQALGGYLTQSSVVHSHSHNILIKIETTHSCEALVDRI